MPVDRSQDRDRAFTLPKLEKELTLRFSRKGKEYEMTVAPVSSSALKVLLYDEWVYSNRQMVDSLTQGKVAYVYMKDMGDQSLDRFMIEMTGMALTARPLSSICGTTAAEMCMTM